MSENYFYSSLSAQEIEDTLVGAVVANAAQSLTTSQKAQARANIGAGAVDTGLIIKGYYATAADLESAHPIAAEGDVYMVGTAAPYDTYIWDAVNMEWKNNGALTPGDSTIDDNDISTTHTWSSSKINTQISSIDLTSLISDSTTASNKTWSSNKISTELSGKTSPSDVATAVAALVDDSTTSASKTWSSQKIAAEIDKCKWKLVWTNPNPSSDFAEQTVPLALTPYSDILIIANQYTGADIHLPFYCRVDGYCYLEVVGTFDGNGTMSLNRRQAVINTSGIEFSDAYSKTYNSSSKSKHNDQLIPLYIYAR